MRALGVWKVLTFYGAMGAIGLMGLSEAHHNHLVPDGHVHWALAVVVGFLSGIALVLASRLVGAHVRVVRCLVTEFRALVMGIGRKQVVFVALLSGASEEILFRGALQPALGLWITTLIFAMLHVGPTRRFVPWTLMALVGGAVFGWLALWSGGLLAPVVAHVMVNFLNLRYLASATSLLRPRLGLNPEGAVQP